MPDGATSNVGQGGGATATANRLALLLAQDASVIKARPTHPPIYLGSSGQKDAPR